MKQVKRTAIDCDWCVKDEKAEPVDREYIPSITTKRNTDLPAWDFNHFVKVGCVYQEGLTEEGFIIICECRMLLIVGTEDSAITCETCGSVYTVSVIVQKVS